MSLGKNIKERRELEGLNIQELAERVETDRSYISHIESDRKVPSVAMLKAIAKVLHCTMDELADDKTA